MINNWNITLRRFPPCSKAKLTYSHSINTLDFDHKYNKHKTYDRIYNHGSSKCGNYVISTENSSYYAVDIYTDSRLINTKCVVIENPIGRRISIDDEIDVFIANGIIETHFSTIYIKNGIIHRDNGAAIIKNVGKVDNEYFLNGTRYTSQEYWELIKNTPNADKMFSELFGMEE